MRASILQVAGTGRTLCTDGFSEGEMELALAVAAIFVVPTALLVLALRVRGQAVAWRPLLLAGLAFAVYMLLLKSRSVVPVPAAFDGLPLIWVGKLLSLAGTLAMLALLPGVGFRAAGLTWTQHKGSLRPALIAGALTLVGAMATTLAFMYDPDTSVGNLLFQATLPGLDEELFMRGLLLLLLHQAFGKGMRILGAETGWGFWLVVAIFGLLHGVTVEDEAVRILPGAIVATGFAGFILTWMRERTGSLVLPILFHNGFNVALAFV
jgi:uncharacterized protein